MPSRSPFNVEPADSRAAAASLAANFPPADRRLTLPLCIFVLVASAWLLFFHLGSYYFWCDEIDTVLLARGVARTGDTSAVIDQNVYAFGNGACLKNLHARYQPPGAYYLAAPFVGRSGTSTFWPRFPFATCGFLTVALLMYWMSRCRLPAAYWITFCMALLGNVALFLFDRQCRYYSLTTLLAATIVYLYFNWHGQRWILAAIVIASMLLCATSYLAHAALYAALACDYLLFMRRRRPFTFLQLALILGPQIVVGLALLSVYNPFASTVVSGSAPGTNILWDRLKLVWFFFRDLNNSELCVGLVVLAAPLLYLWTRNIWLLRGAVAIFIYTLAIAVLQPYTSAASFMASVRYLADEIPLCIAVSALVITTLAGNRWQYAAPLAALVFGFSVLNFPFSPSQWRCRPYDFVQEICNPRETATGRTSQWINEHTKPGESIWVLPNPMVYPLMYYAPEAVYAWQLSTPPEKQFEGLPEINFIGRGSPDYLVMFGPERTEAVQAVLILKGRGLEYQLITVLDVFWDDEIRPEIFWRSFYPIEHFNRDMEAVYIYKRM